MTVFVVRKTIVSVLLCWLVIISIASEYSLAEEVSVDPSYAISTYIHAYKEAMDGHLDKAEEILRPLIQQAEKSNNPYEVANALLQQANCYLIAQRYEKSEHLLKRAAATLINADGPQSYYLWGVLELLANIYYRQARYRDLDMTCKMQLQLDINLKTGHVEARTRKSTVCQDYADFLEKMGRTNEARQVREFLSIVSKAEVKNEPSPKPSGSWVKADELSLWIKETFGSTKPDSLKLKQQHHVADELKRLQKMEANRDLAIEAYTKQDYMQSRRLLESALHDLTVLDLQDSPTLWRIADVLGNLAHVYFVQHNYEQAEPLYKQALTAIRFEQDMTATGTLAALTNQILAQRHYDLSEILANFERAIGTNRRFYSDTAKEAACFIHNLAIIYSARGDFEKADKLLKTAAPVLESSPCFYHIRASFSQFVPAPGGLRVAEALYREQIRQIENKLGQGHQFLATRYDLLTQLYFSQIKDNRFDEQENITLLRAFTSDALERSLAIKEKRFPADSPEMINVLMKLGLRRICPSDRLTKHYKDWIANMKRSGASDTEPTIKLKLDIASHLNAGDANEQDVLQVISLYQDVINFELKAMAVKPPLTGNQYIEAISELIASPRKDNRLRQAIDQSSKYLDNRRCLIDATASLAELYIRQNQYFKAESLLKNVLQVESDERLASYLTRCYKARGKE